MFEVLAIVGAKILKLYYNLHQIVCIIPKKDLIAGSPKKISINDGKHRHNRRRLCLCLSGFIGMKKNGLYLNYIQGLRTMCERMKFYVTFSLPIFHIESSKRVFMPFSLIFKVNYFRNRRKRITLVRFFLIQIQSVINNILNG